MDIVEINQGNERKDLRLYQRRKLSFVILDQFQC